MWTSCAPDFGARSVLDRFQQVEPVVLFAVDGYRYGGKTHDRTAVVAELRAGLPTLRATVHIPLLGTPAPEGALHWDELTAADAEPAYEQVPFDHPLWVLYSSGTTGLPKAIVQSQGGILLEHLKQTGLHLDLGPGDRFFWYTSTGWMMWNFLVSGLLAGATIVLYDGSPGYPDTGAQWRVAEQTGTTVFGTSAAYVIACRKAGVHPGRDFDLSARELRGHHRLPAAARRLPLAARRGQGRPVDRLGQRRHRRVQLLRRRRADPAGPHRRTPGACLGTDLQAWDAEGRPVIDEVGELVVTNPMPSMPIRFWNDPGDVRYRESYFEMFPGVWRHGDWITLTSRGTVVIHGRSDSTLNRQGVRMGSADIYEVVERLPEIRESLVIGIEQPDGGYWMPLFVQLAEGAVLDDALRDRIRTAIRGQLSPRHVPDEVIAVPGVPHTLTGKRIEVPVKRLLQGAPLARPSTPARSTTWRCCASTSGSPPNAAAAARSRSRRWHRSPVVRREDLRELVRRCEMLVHLYRAPLHALASRPSSQNESRPRCLLCAKETSWRASAWS